jgi:hypothetical protein
MWGNGVGAILGQFSTGIFPYNIGAASFAIFASICDLPFRNVFFVLCAVIYMVCSYNTAALMTGNALLSVEGSNMPTMTNVLTNYGFGLLIIAVPVVACVLQMKQQRMLLAKAEAANVLSACVAEMLRRYDTEGVSQLLLQYEAEDDHDPMLVETYRELVANLNQYRPHLPNWMVRLHGGGDDEDEDITPSESARSNRSRRSAMSRMSTTHSALSVVSRARSGSVRSGQSAARHEMSDNLHAGPVPRHVTVAIAVIELAVAPELSMSGRGSAMSRFADAVHSLAAATHCAVHSFIGDTVQLSWNATVKAVQPEVKAARFLARLKDAMKDDWSVTVGGAAMHGKAITQFAGTGAVQALAVSMEWRAALRALTTFAQRHSAFIVAEQTAAAAQHAVTSRPVDALAVADAVLVAHEVLVERNDDDDEWMYVLAKKGDDVVGDAFRLCLEGDYGGAVSKLAALAEDVATQPTVSNLLRRAEAALANPPAHFADAL